MNWWAGMCHYKTEDRKELGLFVDQKYLDILPVQFEILYLIKVMYDSRAVAQLAQTISNNRIADLVTLAFQIPAQLPQAERCPQLPPHRIASRHRFDQRLEVGKQGWVLGYPRFATATPSAYPVILGRCTVFQIGKPPVDRPSRQTRRRSCGAHATMSNHTRFRRSPAASAPLIQQRSHRSPTLPQGSNVRSIYHATILSRPMLFRESPSDNSYRA